VGSGEQGEGGAHGGQEEKCAEVEAQRQKRITLFSSIYFAVSLSNFKPEQEANLASTPLLSAGKTGHRKQIEQNAVREEAKERQKERQNVGSVNQKRWIAGWRKSWRLLQREQGQKSVVFWNVTASRLIRVHQRFGENYCLRLQCH
jgi:hypothetical protein